MVHRQESNECSPSATWEFRKVKIRSGAAGKTQRGAKRSSFKRLPRADRTRELTLRIVYRGGAESWWFIKARGEHQAFPGWMALEDVMGRVLSEY